MKPSRAQRSGVSTSSASAIPSLCSPSGSQPSSACVTNSSAPSTPSYGALNAPRFTGASFPPCAISAAVAASPRATVASSRLKPTLPAAFQSFDSISRGAGEARHDHQAMESGRPELGRTANSNNLPATSSGMASTSKDHVRPTKIPLGKRSGGDGMESKLQYPKSGIPLAFSTANSPMHHQSAAAGCKATQNGWKSSRSNVPRRASASPSGKFHSNVTARNRRTGSTESSRTAFLNGGSEALTPGCTAPCCTAESNPVSSKSVVSSPTTSNATNLGPYTAGSSATRNPRSRATTSNVSSPTAASGFGVNSKSAAAECDSGGKDSPPPLPSLIFGGQAQHERDARDSPELLIGSSPDANEMSDYEDCGEGFATSSGHVPLPPLPLTPNNSSNSAEFPPGSFAISLTNSHPNAQSTPNPHHGTHSVPASLGHSDLYSHPVPQSRQNPCNNLSSLPKSRHKTDAVASSHPRHGSQSVHVSNQNTPALQNAFQNSKQSNTNYLTSASNAAAFQNGFVYTRTNTILRSPLTPNGNSSNFLQFQQPENYHGTSSTSTRLDLSPGTNNNISDALATVTGAEICVPSSQTNFTNSGPCFTSTANNTTDYLDFPYEDCIKNGNVPLINHESNNIPDLYAAHDSTNEEDSFSGSGHSTAIFINNLCNSIRSAADSCTPHSLVSDVLISATNNNQRTTHNKDFGRDSLASSNVSNGNLILGNVPSCREKYAHNAFNDNLQLQQKITKRAQPSVQEREAQVSQRNRHLRNHRIHNQLLWQKQQNDLQQEQLHRQQHLPTSPSSQPGGANGDAFSLPPNSGHATKVSRSNNLPVDSTEGVTRALTSPADHPADSTEVSRNYNRGCQDNPVSVAGDGSPSSESASCLLPPGHVMKKRKKFAKNSGSSSVSKSFTYDNEASVRETNILDRRPSADSFIRLPLVRKSSSVLQFKSRASSDSNTPEVDQCSSAAHSSLANGSMVASGTSVMNTGDRNHVNSAILSNDSSLMQAGARVSGDEEVTAKDCNSLGFPQGQSVSQISNSDVLTTSFNSNMIGPFTEINNTYRVPLPCANPSEREASPGTANLDNSTVDNGANFSASGTRCDPKQASCYDLSSSDVAGSADLATSAVQKRIESNTSAAVDRSSVASNDSSLNDFLDSAGVNDAATEFSSGATSRPYSPELGLKCTNNENSRVEEYEEPSQALAAHENQTLQSVNETPHPSEDKTRLGTDITDAALGGEGSARLADLDSNESSQISLVQSLSWDRGENLQLCGGPKQEELKRIEKAEQLCKLDLDKEEEEAKEEEEQEKALEQHIQQQILRHQHGFHHQKRHLSAGCSFNSSSSRAQRRQQLQRPCRSVPRSGCEGAAQQGSGSGLQYLTDLTLEDPSEVAAFIVTLRKERSRLLQEIESEESERSHYNSQLDALTERLAALSAAGRHQSAEARGIEGEIRRLREAGHHRLGSPCSASRRRHHRLHAINTIEKTIQRLHHLPPAELCHRSASQGPLSQSEVYGSSDRDFTNRQGSFRKRDKAGRLTASDNYPSFGGNYENSQHSRDSRYSDGSITSGDLTCSNNRILGNKSSVSTFQPASVSNSRRSPFKSPEYISTRSNYLHHLNPSAGVSHSDSKTIFSSKSSSSCGTASGTWYERLPNRLPRPQQHPLYHQNNRQSNINCYASGGKGTMDVANANTMMDAGLSTADEVSDIPSSSSTVADGQRNSSMEPDSLDSGVDHRVNSTFQNGDGSHTYDDENEGHCSGNGPQDGNYTNEDGVPRLPSAIEAVLRGVWPFEKALWHSSPATVGLSHTNGTQVDPPGIMATSSVTSRRAQSQQQLLSNKVEMVYGLLSMFSSGDRAEMSKTLLAMSSSPDSCLALRQSGCLPLLIQLLHGGGGDGGDVPSRETRLRASQALQNVVHANVDEKRGRREARVLRLLEQIRAYSDYLYERLERTSAGQGPLLEDDMDRHPCPAMAAVMKLSFDEEHRLAMCTLGGLHAIAELIKRDHDAHGATTPDNFCITLRRYAGMALTNLTFGAGTNKALVCSFSSFLRALVAQLSSPSQDLRQVTSSVIRNLSWRADSSSKQALREAGAVAGLMRAALTATKEATLKVILSAVWNLSAHCSVNKAEICAVEGALAFICTSLTYKSQSRTLAIVENAGGILRNISSHIAVREDLRQVLRDHDTLRVILSQLRSPSLTVVSNACGTLWNLSARCAQDQQTLWDLGAVPMLRSLINSKHKMISMGSSAALKNLLQAKPEGASLGDSKHGAGLPTLQARRQRALEQELDQSLAETNDNIESSPRASPTGDNVGFFADAVNGRPMFHSLDPRYGNMGIMTDSIQSNHSTQSDNTHDRMQHLLSRQHQTNGSCNGHRPVDLALKHVNSHGDENEHAKQEGSGTASERNNSVANTKGALHPSDPLYNLYNKYVNPNRGSARKDSKHGKSHGVNDGKLCEDDERGGSSSSLVNGSRRPPVKVDNYVTDPAVHNENDDQPTDFSLRYPEEDDPNKNRPQKKVARDGKSEDEEEEFFGAADSVQTYFTEGTPLNFSTATSLTDLREQPGVRDCKLGTQQEVHGEEEEVDKQQEEEDEAAEGGRLSRFSSMSSISSGEISAGHEEELEEDSDLQELVLAEGERVAAAAAKAAQHSSPHHSPAAAPPSATTDQQQQEQEWSAGATPLMFSRTTSLGSLSSFPAQQHQHLDDSGSVVSEFSRLASGAVSPSDLPDSPSQTMPPSPRQRARAHHDQHPPASNQLNSSLGVFNDSPRQFREEGTPCLLSRGTSLSSLTLDDRTASTSQPPLTTSRVRGDGKDSSTNTSSNNVSTNASNSPALARPAAAVAAGRGRSLAPRTSSIPRPQSLGQNHERSRSSDPHSTLSPTGSDHSATRGRTKEKRHSAATEADSEKLLNACISSGMPNRRHSDAKTPVRSVSRSSSFVKSPRTPLGAPPIPIPPPPPPPRLGGSGEDCWGVNRVSNIPINTVNLQVTTTTLNLNQQSEGVGSDTLHSYCTEDTPAALSQAGSVSDLSQVSLEQRGSTGAPRGAMRRPLGPSHGLLLQGDSTDSSDAEGMLNRCIQAAMPKLKSIKGKPPSPRHNYGVPQPRASYSNSKLPSGLPLSPSSTTSPGLPSALPRKGSIGASPHASPRHRPVPVARVSPALKLTPSDRSVDASPSKPSARNDDLKMNNFNGEEVKNWGAVEGTPLGCSNATSLSDLTVDSCEHEGHRKIQAGSSRIETVKRYATEGTPANFSRCDSLSSLSCDDDGGQITSRLAEAPQCHSNVNDIHAHPTTAESEEIPQRFNVEDTPAALSRRSSLSSIEGVACDASGVAKRGHQDANAPRNFGVEDTPVCFSRNSSLSSLSVESYPEETTPSEQALLQHCINQGMPRSEQRSSRGPVGRGGKRGKSGSRIPGLAHSPGRSPARSPGRNNVPGVPMQRLRLVPPAASTSRNGSSLPNEAESSKLRTDLEQTEKSQLDTKASGANVAEEECSVIDDITEISEPISEAITAPIAEVASKTGSSKSSPEDRLQSSSDDARVSPGKANGSSHGIGSDVSMTDSMIVAAEAIRVAQAVEVQAMEGRSSDDASIASQTINSDGLLEDVVAPSAMESVLSLSTSLNDNNQGNQQRKVMECRHTRKIPTMVRRALGDHEMSDVNGTNGGSLASSCHSNLENVVPPAFMEADDMESSMISVASITSEVAEPRHSPPSLNSSIPSEAMAAIEAPAQQLARLFSKEARQQMSSVTLTAGEDTSTCQEVTELDKDTLGVQDTATDTELAVDDIPQDIPDLPQDSPLHKARHSPQVTPSMLRKAVHNDRFRTFTKADKSNAQASSSDASKSSVPARSGLTPKERRSEQSERYRTRILSTDDDIEMDSPTTPTVENPMGHPLQRRSSREKRQSNPARYQTRTIESVDSTQQQEEGIVDFRDGAELDLTSEQLEALSQDANIVICTLNENREANTTDLLHGLSQENILDIETLSLISSDEDDNTFDVSSPASPAVASRPRIVKPGEESATDKGEQAEPAGKGIRGKRKALYPGNGKALATVRPTQQQQPVSASHTRAVPTSATAFKPTPRTQGTIPQPKSIPQPQQHKAPSHQQSQQQSSAQPGSPKLPRATRASALRQKAGRVGSSSSSSPASSAGSSPRIGATPKTRQPPPQVHSTPSGLKRQNTFTKEDQDDGEMTQKPVAATKQRYRRDTVQPSPAVSVRPLSRPSSHDGSMRADQPKSYSLTRDARPPTANEMTEWNKDPKSGKPVKKDVTSRIANLWKKVEKAQAAPKPKEHDGKVWISKAKNKTPDLDSPPPLLRSSTYEKLTVGGDSRSDSERTETGKTKTRLGLKLSRFRGRDSKSSPPSEASTPIDISGASTPRGREAASGDGKRRGSFVVMDGEEEACAVRTPQSAVVSPFHYHPPDSPSISVGIQRNTDVDEKGSPLSVSTRIPLPKSVVMSNNPRDDNGNAPYV